MRRRTHVPSSKRWCSAGWRPTGPARQEATGSHMADLYTEDATYGWNVGPNDEFMAVGRDEIRDIALGLEMAGLEGWTYPYQKVLIDEQQGEILGLWKQVADATKADGSQLRDRRARAAAGSATRGTSSGRGSATSSTSATPAPSSWR